MRVGIPPDDNRERYICDACGTIHYQNPNIIAGCLPRWENKILMCKRAIVPRLGYWTTPAGFMENGESVEEGALRETMEEANAEVEIVRLFSVFQHSSYQPGLHDLSGRFEESQLLSRAGKRRGATLQ